jgi:hypothetical protein
MTTPDDRQPVDCLSRPLTELRDIDMSGRPAAALRELFRDAAEVTANLIAVNEQIKSVYRVGPALVALVDQQLVPKINKAASEALSQATYSIRADLAQDIRVAVDAAVAREFAALKNDLITLLEARHVGK